MKCYNHPDNDALEYDALVSIPHGLSPGQEIPNPEQVLIIKELGMEYYSKYPTVIGGLANDYSPKAN